MSSDRTGARAVPSAAAPRDRLLVLAGVAVLATLGFEMVPLPVRAQVSPLASLIALVALPAAAGRVRALPRSPVLIAVLGFVLFAAAHSVVALGIDALVCGPSALRTAAWLRQLAALAAGASVFVVLRVTLFALRDGAVARAVAIGALPGVVLALVNVAWGTLRVAPAAHIVTVARYMMLPPGLSVPGHFADPERASGFCLEPSHFSIFLAAVAIPATFVWLVAARRRWLPALVIAAAGIALLWTFSVTGVAVAAGILLALALATRLRRAALVMLAAGAVALVALIVAFPNNYIVFQAGRVVSLLAHGDLAHLPPSVTVVVFGTVGPFARVLSSLNLLGYGLGGTATHAGAILPAAALHDIGMVSWPDMPNLTTSPGRVFAETGLAGLILFTSMWVTALRRLAGPADAPPAGGVASVARAAAFAGLVGLAIAHTIKIGSFAVPFVWFWLAYVDARTAPQGNESPVQGGRGARRLW